MGLSGIENENIRFLVCVVIAIPLAAFCIWAFCGKEAFVSIFGRAYCDKCGALGKYECTEVGSAWHLDRFRCKNGHAFYEG